jgi:hypothetical protein
MKKIFLLEIYLFSRNRVYSVTEKFITVDAIWRWWHVHIAFSFANYNRFKDAWTSETNEAHQLLSNFVLIISFLFFRE